MAGSIDEEHLANSSITQNKIANNSVGTPELINGSVNSDKILDGTIVNADVNASAAIAASKISGLATSATTDTTSATNIGSGTLPAARIADDSIVEAKLDIHADPAGTNKFLGYTSNGMEWAVPPDNDTVYTHPTSAGNKHVPAGGSADQYLKYSSAGTAVWADLAAGGATGGN